MGALALARRLGAGRLLLGDVVGTPNRIVLTASLLGSARGDSIAKLSVEGPPDSLAWLVDRLAARLLAETSTEGASRSASLTSTSLPALRAYLDGQAKTRRVDVVGAAKDFERALDADSTFALAALGLRMASSWYGDPTLQQRGLQIAWRERARLSQRDQALLVAIGGPRYPTPATTQELLAARERYLAIAPDRADAWYLLGDHVFHYGWVLNVPNPEERAFESFQRASEIDSTYVVGYLHGLPLALTLGDTVAARRFERLRLGGGHVAATGWSCTVGRRRGRKAIPRKRRPSRTRSICRSTCTGWISSRSTAARARTTSVAGSTRHWRRRRPTRSDADSHGWRTTSIWSAGRPSAALTHLVASADSAGDVNIPVLKIRDALIADGDTDRGARCRADAPRLRDCPGLAGFRAAREPAGGYACARAVASVTR